MICEFVKTSQNLEVSNILEFRITDSEITAKSVKKPLERTTIVANIVRETLAANYEVATIRRSGNLESAIVSASL